MNRAETLKTLLTEIRGQPTRDSVYRAYVFALFSIQVPLGRHEAAYRAFIAKYPTYWSMRDAGLAKLNYETRTLGLNFCKTKAFNLYAFNPDLMVAFQETAWPMEDKQCRAWVACSIPGLSYAKASFFLMLLGRIGVGCLDVHMLRLLGTDRAFAPKTRDAYEAIEAKLGPVPGLTQWLQWIDHMGIEGVGHEVYFASQGVLN